MAKDYKTFVRLNGQRMGKHLAEAITELTEENLPKIIDVTALVDKYEEDMASSELVNDVPWREELPTYEEEIEKAIIKASRAKGFNISKGADSNYHSCIKIW